MKGRRANASSGKRLMIRPYAHPGSWGHGVKRAHKDARRAGWRAVGWGRLFMLSADGLAGWELR